jgi:hypothetical protein
MCCDLVVAFAVAFALPCGLQEIKERKVSKPSRRSEKKSVRAIQASRNAEQICTKLSSLLRTMWTVGDFAIALFGCVCKNQKFESTRNGICLVRKPA